MKNDLSSRTRLLWGGTFAAALLSACASAPVPDAQMAVSRSAINEAMSAGAAEVAPLELRNAREKLARAEQAVTADNNEEARRLAEEAEVDARLAAAKARTARANLAALEIQKSIRVLRDNLDTGSPNSAPTTR